VNIDLPALKNLQTGYQILAYLVEHPEAQDTVEGIVEWWLLERAIKFQETKIIKALSELVAKGLIVEHKSGDSQIHYRINQNKNEEIQKLIKQRME
jgi:predicted transcriptional regulator